MIDRKLLAESRILAVAGKVERSVGHVTLLATRLQPYTWVSAKGATRKRQQDDQDDQDDAPSPVRDARTLANGSFGHQGNYRVARP